MFLKWQREDNYANIQMNYLGTTTAFNLQVTTKYKEEKEKSRHDARLLSLLLNQIVQSSPSAADFHGTLIQLRAWDNDLLILNIVGWLRTLN